MGRKRRTNATSQQIMDAFKTATNPNATAEAKAKAESWLRSENAKMTKAANERIADMKRKNVQGTAAYNILQRDLADKGLGNKLIYRKSMDIDDLKNNMLAARKFLESQTSSAAGEKRRLDRMWKTLTSNTEERKAIIHPPEDKKEAEKLKQKFYDFLKSDAFNDFKKTIGTNIVAEGYEAIENGAKLDDLIGMFDDYQGRTDIDAFDVWDSWTQGTLLPPEEWSN